MNIEHRIILGCQEKKRGDQHELYELLSPTLYLICIRYTRDREEAKDLLQETFVQIFDKIEQYQFKGSFEGWCKRTTVNQALQFLRKKNILSEAEDIENNKNDINRNYFYSQETEKNDLLHLLNKLPEKRKLIFNLHVIEGYNHREIGEMLGMTENACSSLYYKAKIQLQKVYEQESQKANA